MMTTPCPALPEQEAAAGGGSPIYLDHAATTAMCADAFTALTRGLTLYGNPSSRHSLGCDAREALEQARTDVALLLGRESEEVVFTGSGSEAINLALQGTFAAHGWRGHLVTTAIEHSAVLETAKVLAGRGVEVTVVAPQRSGHVRVEDVIEAIRPDTLLVSVMHANNETGAIQPVEAITQAAHAAGAAVHVDAVQTAGKLPLEHLDADLLSVSAHKFAGPKGVGALGLRRGHVLQSLVHGGGQEGHRRAGTENLPGIMAMAAAAKAALRHTGDPDYQGRRRRLREQLLTGLLGLPEVYVNVEDPVMPETLNVAFAGVRADTLADILDTCGICVSTGSACHAGEDSPSHVLTAMGLDVDHARASVRFSFGPTTTSDQVAVATRATTTAVRRLRTLADGARTPAAVGVRRHLDD